MTSRHNGEMEDTLSLLIWLSVHTLVRTGHAVPRLAKYNQALQIELELIPQIQYMLCWKTISAQHTGWDKRDS